MTDAIRAQYSDFKLIKTRSVLQIVMELPIERAEAALALLGIPQPGTQTWCAIARLNDSAAAPRDDIGFERTDASQDSGVSPDAGSGAAGRPALTPGEKLVQMAGILCEDIRFQEWLRAMDADAAAALVRIHCGITSRRELATNETAAQKFRELVGRFEDDMGYSTWRKPA